MGSMSIVHWMIVVGVVVLLFGRHKISDLMGDVAHGIKSFKKGMQDDKGASATTDEQLSDNHTAPSKSAPPVQARIGENC